MADFAHSIPLPENRLALEALIQAAIDRLDDLDPDPDLEEEPDGEPILGAPEARAGSWNGLRPEAFTDDRELDDADDEDGGDDEPSLGSFQDMSQERWASMGTDDREEQCDDEGASDADLEEDDASWPAPYCPNLVTLGRPPTEPSAIGSCDHG